LTGATFAKSYLVAAFKILVTPYFSKVALRMHYPTKLYLKSKDYIKLYSAGFLSLRITMIDCPCSLIFSRWKDKAVLELPSIALY